MSPLLAHIIVKVVWNICGHAASFRLVQTNLLLQYSAMMAEKDLCPLSLSTPSYPGFSDPFLRESLGKKTATRLCYIRDVPLPDIYFKCQNDEGSITYFNIIMCKMLFLLKMWVPVCGHWKEKKTRTEWPVQWLWWWWKTISFWSPWQW